MIAQIQPSTRTNHHLEEINIAKHIISKLERNLLADVITLLDRLARGQEFSAAWIAALQEALQSGNWGVLSPGFINREFIGKNGYFLLIAPHQLTPEKGSSVMMTAILGKILPLNSVTHKQLEEQIVSVFDELLEPVPELIPFDCIAACGHFGHEDSEALVLPEAWMIPESLLGPVLNNITQHRNRYDRLVRTNIPRIFAEETANLLLNSLRMITMANSSNKLSINIMKLDMLRA